MFSNAKPMPYDLTPSRHVTAFFYYFLPASPICLRFQTLSSQSFRNIVSLTLVSIDATRHDKLYRESAQRRR